MERNHGRRFPVGVNHPEETTRFNRFSIGYSWRILDTARAIKALEKRAGISEIEKERERDEGGSRGRGSFIIRGRFKEPGLLKGGETSKKLVRVEWCAAAIVRRKQCPTLSSFIFSGRWRRKEEGGRQVSPGKRRSPLSRAQRSPLFYALSGFMVYELARGLARSILIRGQIAVVLISLQ